MFGGDWPIPDGKGGLDTIHVMDLAEGHHAALNCLLLAAEAQLLTLTREATRDSPSWGWSRAWKPPAAVPSPTRSQTVGLAKLPPALPIPLRPLSAWAGTPSETLNRSATTAEPGNSKTLRYLPEPAESLPTGLGDAPK